MRGHLRPGLLGVAGADRREDAAVFVHDELKVGLRRGGRRVVRFDLMFFADILAVPDRYSGSTDPQLRYGALGSMRLDPTAASAPPPASPRTWA